jgi:peptidyl-lysine (3S)-dioxygenase / protease
MAWPFTNPQAWAIDQLDTLRREYHDFNPPVVDQLGYPTSVEFGKQVNRGRPCVYSISDADSHVWPALHWDHEDLISKVHQPVDIAITPFGNADSLIENPQDPHNKIFVEPASIQLTLKHFLSRLATHSSSNVHDSVAYLQSQCSNLTSTPLAALANDVPQNFDFAVSVLGEPDAINIWIGDEKSVTSVHRDPYENLYLVLKGSKTFRLWAGLDEVCMPTKLVPTGRYKYSEANGEPKFEVEVDHDPTNTIPWVDMDPLVIQKPDCSSAGRLPAKMHIVKVEEGQILFLPAGWFHHVTQECGKWDDGSRAPAIAVNYWYDMDYSGDRYVMRQLVSRLVELARVPEYEVSNNSS